METVIEEIAKQLGIAVDQAGQFITTYLPDYAALKVVQSATPLVVVWALFLLLAVIAIGAFVVLRKADKIQDELSMWVLALALGVSLAIFIIAIPVTLFEVPNVIGWQSYPEAMLIDMALLKIGG